MKLFNSNDVQIIEFCHLEFNIKLLNEQIGYRCKKFASSEFVSMNLVNCRVHRLTSIYFNMDATFFSPALVLDSWRKVWRSSPGCH